MENQIHWNEAVQKEKEQKEQDALHKIEYDKNVRLACGEVWELIGLDDMRGFNDVADIAMNFGVDEEDVIFGLM